MKGILSYKNSRLNSKKLFDQAFPFPCSALLGLAQQPDPLGGLAEHVAVVAQDVDLVLLPGAAH